MLKLNCCSFVDPLVRLSVGTITFRGHIIIDYTNITIRIITTMPYFLFNF